VDLYEQQLQGEQQRLMDAMHAEPPPPAHQHDRYGQPLPQSYNDLNRNDLNRHSNRLPPPSSANSSYVPHTALNQQRQLQQQQQEQPPNYQNINFVSEARADSGPAGQVPPPPTPSADHQVYEPYRPQQASSPAQQGFGSKPTQLYQPGQQFVPPPQQQQQQVSPLTPGGKNRDKTSAWDREEKEKVRDWLQ
jgi:hypothetical protein